MTYAKNRMGSGGVIEVGADSPVRVGATARGVGGTVFTGATLETLLAGEALTVANKSGSPMTAGQLVYVSGYDATLGAPTVTLADADTAGKVAQLVIAAAIADGATGTALESGLVTGLNTSAASAVGSLAYLGQATAGSFVWAALTGADMVSQVIGICVTKHASTGSILFFPGRRVVLATGTSGLQDDAVTAAKTDTATAGVAEGSKIVVLGATKNLDTLVIADGGLYLGAGAGTSVSATAAQINRTAVTTPGTAEASKAAILGANKNLDILLTGSRGITVANKTGGTLTKGTLVVASGFDTTLGAPTVVAADADSSGFAQFVLPADILTNEAGAAYEVGVVTGIDTDAAAGVGSLAYLGQATAGTFVWAALTGADMVSQVVGVCLTKHATTGSMVFFPGLRNILKVGTSAIQDDAITAAKTDTATAGVAEASKIAVLGADKNLDTLVIADSGLKLGAGAGTAVTRTAAQLNLLVQGVAGGYMLARGTATVTGSLNVATGLTTVVGVAVSFAEAQSVNSLWVYVTKAGAAGTIDITVLKATANDNVTPTASSTATAIEWVAIGT
jgi:hypothetical protein